MRQQKSQCHAMPDSPESNGPTPNWGGSFSQVAREPNLAPSSEEA